MNYALALIASLSLVGAAAAGGRTIFVNPSAAGAQDGMSWPTAFRSLHDALDAAVDGDDIWIAQGVYVPERDEFGEPASGQWATFTVRDRVRIFGGFEGKESSLAERGSPRIHETILDGLGQSQHVVTVPYIDTSGPFVRLDGLTIRNGNAGSLGKGGGGVGGGVYAEESLYLVFCRFFTNRAEYAGGAVYVAFGGGKVINCEFRGNVVDGFDGLGGALAMNGSAFVVGSVFAGNRVTNAVESGGGGAAYFQESEASVYVHGSTFHANSVVGSGGRGGAIFSRALTTEVFASILWANQANRGPQIWPVDAPRVELSDIQGGWFFGADNIETDPLFVDAVTGNLHLRPNSPCIDRTGNYAAPPDFADVDADGDPCEPTPLDLEYTPRSQGVRANMGAFESPDCNENNRADSVDIALDPKLDCDGNGTPDSCETDSDSDGVIDACDGCPHDAARTEPGPCGCSAPDGDGDGVPDCIDNCPNAPNADQADSDGDGTGDACEPPPPPPPPPTPLAPRLENCPDKLTNCVGDRAKKTFAIAELGITRPTVVDGAQPVTLQLETPAIELGIGVHTLRYVATDALGRSTACEFIVEIQDLCPGRVAEDCPPLYRENTGLLSFFGVPIGCGPSCLAMLPFMFAGLAGMRRSIRRR